MDAFQHLLQQMGSNDGDDGHEGCPHPEAQIMELQDVAERYGRRCPFKAGDIVTPRGNCDVKGAGSPHVVLEVPDKPHRNFDGGESVGSNAFGKRLNMRVAVFRGRDICAYWVESYFFVPYEDSTLKAAE